MCSVVFVAVISLAYYSLPFSVKLRIKSFNIPELFINVPENATIGSLKVLYGHLQVTDYQSCIHLCSLIFSLVLLLLIYHYSIIDEMCDTARSHLTFCLNNQTICHNVK